MGDRDVAARAAVRARCTSMVVSACLIAGGCSHAYLYGRHAPPTLDRGDLVVPTRKGDERFTVKRMGVSGPEAPLSFRVPTADELAEIRAGVVPDSVHTLRIDVDNSGVLWRDWALAGFGVGASTVLLMIGLSGAIEPGGGDGFALTLPFTMLFAAVAGTEFMLFGLGIGAALESGQTDMRYRVLADD